jgi:anaerobic magnesium-protoporphyrin IX monomethyl ester cyclase
MTSQRHASILVAHSYYLRYDEKQWRRMKPYPPLATLIVAAHLREQGHVVHLFDAMLAHGVEDFSARLKETQPDVVALVEDNFNFLTKMCTTRMRDAALNMIRAARASGCKVVVNGSDASDHENKYLDAGADVIVLGEPEEAITAVVEHWTDQSSAHLGEIPGLAFRSVNGEGSPAHVSRTTARPIIEDLDAIPFPAWDILDVERYRHAWTNAHGRLSWNMVTSRGCPYKCNWCAKPLFGTRYAQRSPADVAEEMRQLRHRVAPDHVWFADDIFGLTAAWIEAFGEEVRKRDAQIPFMMQSRPNLMKVPVVAALADAGAEEVWLGAESGSQRILDAMDKGTTIEQIRTATRNLKAHGIRACWFIQLGYLGEEWDDVLLTRDLIRSERPDDIGVSVSYPLPGTKFFEVVKEQLGRKTNWQDSDDLAMMFRGTYQTPFYRAIRALLHDEVDAGPNPTEDLCRRLDARWDELKRTERAQRSTATDNAGMATS